MQVATPPRRDCPGCAHENPATAERCDGCGVDLARAPLPGHAPSATSSGPPPGLLASTDLDPESAARRRSSDLEPDSKRRPIEGSTDLPFARLFASPPEDAECAIGKTLDGRYLILAKLGEGGMGTVFRVEHVRMGKVMALKVLRSDIAKKRTSVERFRREAKVVSRLDHTNAISVFDCGSTETGLLYIAMEYVPGRDLSSIVREEGRLEERRALKLVVQLLKGLAQAHAVGIIHRDVKPANVMITRSREDAEHVKILDFGIAKLAESDREDQGRITGGADVVGTPSGMSPEQARGLPLDARSDVYSATALLFELLTGRAPFVGAPLEVVSQHLVAPSPRLADVLPGVPFSEALEGVIAKGLAKDANHRFQSADEMRRAIEAVLGAPVSTVSSDEILNIARREDWDAFERSFARRHLLKRVAALLGLGAVSIGLAWEYTREEQRPPPPRVPVAEEAEPNDKAPWATLIAFDQPVKGFIGTRATPNFSDRDIYELTVPQEGVLTLEVTAVPNINLVAEVFKEPSAGESEAPVIAAVDDAPTGMSEEVNDLVVKPGRYLIRLSDKRRLDEPDGPPRENTSDPYQLRVALEAPRLFQEREPNNEAHEAMVVGALAPVLGKAGTPGIVGIVRLGPAPLPTWAVDLYRFTDAPPKAQRCAILGGIRFANLRLTAFSEKAQGRLKSLGSVQVRDGRAQGLCVKGEVVLFEVRVELGTTGGTTYPVAFMHDRAGGLAGLMALVKALPTLDRTQEARLLVERALELMPKAEDAPLLREILSQLPQVDPLELAPR